MTSNVKAPKFKNGKKTEPGTMTVWWNGIKVHNNTKLTNDNTTAGRGGDPAKPGPLMLQDHGGPVQFRNIWLLPITSKEEASGMICIDTKPFIMRMQPDGTIKCGE